MNQKALSFGLLTLLGLGVSLGLAHCGGGRGALPGQQCARGANPIPMNPPQQKLDVNQFTPPDGEYRLTRAALHFRGDPTRRAPDGFQVVLRAEIPKGSKDAQTTVRTECFRNAKVDQMHHALVPTINRLVIENGRIKETDVKDFGFNMDDAGVFAIADGPSLRKSATPRQVFERASDETFLLQHGADFEIRTNGRGVNGRYTATMLLHRVN